MQKLDAPEGFAFNLYESADAIVLRIEDHREDPLFQGPGEDECRKVRRGIRAIGLDPATAEVESSGKATLIQGEAGAYTVRHLILRWRRQTQPQSVRVAA